MKIYAVEVDGAILGLALRKEKARELLLEQVYKKHHTGQPWEYENDYSYKLGGHHLYVKPVEVIE